MSLNSVEVQCTCIFSCMYLIYDLWSCHTTANPFFFFHGISFKVTASPRQACYCRGSWTLHRIQICRDPAWSNQWRWEPNPWPVHGLRPLAGWLWNHSECFCISQGQPAKYKISYKFSKIINKDPQRPYNQADWNVTIPIPPCSTLRYTPQIVGDWTKLDVHSNFTIKVSFAFTCNLTTYKVHFWWTWLCYYTKCTLNATFPFPPSSFFMVSLFEKDN